MGTTAVAMGVIREDMVARAHRITGPLGSQPMEVQVITATGVSTVLTAAVIQQRGHRKLTM